jgi:hypothetical protein
MLRIQRGSYLCWLVHGSALHSNWCTISCKADTDFADESMCLLADNIKTEVLRIHRSQKVLKMLSVNCGLISPLTTDCRNQLQKWTLLPESCGCKTWITFMGSKLQQWCCSSCTRFWHSSPLSKMFQWFSRCKFKSGSYVILPFPQ